MISVMLFLPFLSPGQDSEGSKMKTWLTNAVTKLQVIKTLESYNVLFVVVTVAVTKFKIQGVFEC